MVLRSSQIFEGKMRQHPIPTVHKLKVFLYEGDLVYPQEVVQETLGLFSTRGKAEAFLRQWLPEHEASEARVSDPGQKATLLSCEIREIRLDVEADQALLFSRVYDRSGNLIGCENERENEPFFGRRPQDCRFKEGELVQFVHNGELQTGIVRGLPSHPRRDRGARSGYRPALPSGPVRGGRHPGRRSLSFDDLS